MKIDNPVETLVGAAVIVVAVGFGLHANQKSGGEIAATHYPVIAKFSSATGVSPGTDVRIAGVKVGSVSATELDPKTYEAKVTMAVRGDIELPEDTLAKVDAEGLLGGSYIALEPGGAVDLLAAGDEIEFTQGAVSLTGLISKVVTGGGGSEGKSE